MGNTTFAPIKTELCKIYYVGFTPKELEYILSDPKKEKDEKIHDIEEANYPDSSCTVLIPN